MGSRDSKTWRVTPLLLERATSRRVRVRRIRLEAWEAQPVATQLSLWDGAVGAGLADVAMQPSGRCPRALPARTAALMGGRAAEATCGFIATSADPGRDAALERALDRVRGRFGTDALVSAAWMAHGLVVRPPSRP